MLKIKATSVKMILVSIKTLKSKKFLSAFLVFLGGLILGFILLLPYSLNPATATIDRGDSLLNTWIIAWVNHQLLSHPFQLFEANIFHPYEHTLAYSENLLPTALMVMPIGWLTSNPIPMHTAAVLLTFALSALGMFLFCRQLGFSNYGAIFGAAVFTLAPMKFEELARVQVLSSHWMPFVLLFMEKYLQKPKKGFLVAVAVFASLQILASYYHGFFMCVLICLYLAARWLNPATRYHWVHLLKCGAAFMLTAVLISPLTWPYLKLHESLNFSRDMAEMCKYSADLTAYLHYQHTLGHIAAFRPSPAFFPGIAVTMLVVFGIYNLLRNKENNWYLAPNLNTKSHPENRYLAPILTQKFPVLFGGFSIITGFFLSLGPELIIAGHGTEIPLPARLLWHILPGFKAFRILWRAEILVSVGLALISAIGIEWLMVKIKPTINTLLFLTILLFLIFERGRWPVKYFQWPTPENYPEYTEMFAESNDIQAFTVDPFEQFHDLSAMLYSTVHWKPMVNGWSGFFPPDYHRTKWLMDRFPTKGSIQMLRDKQVSHIVIHTKEVPVFHVRNMRRECAQFDELEIVADFGETLIYRLRDVQ